MTSRRNSLLAVAAMLGAACGGSEPSPPPPVDPYAGAPPLGTAIPLGSGSVISSGTTDTGWRWVPFADDSLCTDDPGSGQTSSTGLAINWGTNSDLVVFLQGGGACWDFVTCGGASSLGFPGTASTGPFGANEFRDRAYLAYPGSWLTRANLPAALTGATMVFVPYCTGDVHGGDAVATYTAPPELAAFHLAPVTWHHVGHANLMAFLKRLGATFPSPAKLVVAGSSAGGFGALIDYPAFRWYWPAVKSYLIDDSGPPLSTVPPGTHGAWYANWNLGATLDHFCAGCRSDLSQGMVEVKAHFPNDRIALLSHLQDLTIREFFGTYTIVPPTLTPMSASAFETSLRSLGTTVVDAVPATSSARYFLTSSPTATDHTTLTNPAAVVTPNTANGGLVDWLAKMLSDDDAWASATD